MHDAANEDVYRDEGRQHEVVHRPVTAETDDSEDTAPRNTLQAILAAGELRLQADEEHELGQGQRDHREINTLTTYRDGADHEAESHGDGDSGGDPLDGAPTVCRHQPSRDIGRRPEIRGVAEGQHLGVAEQQIERAGEHGKAQQLHQKYRIQAEEGRRQGQDRKDHIHPGVGTHPLFPAK